MSTKYFIGGNKFYDSEEEAKTDLRQFQVEHEIPDDAFVIVKINKDEPGDTFKPLLEAATVH